MRSPEHGAATAANGEYRNGGAEASVNDGADKVREATPYRSDPRWRENQKVSVAARSSSNALVPALAAIVETGHWREFVHPMQGLKQYATFAAYCDDFLGLSAQAVETLLDKSQHKADARQVRRLIREGIEPAARPGRPSKPRDTHVSHHQANDGIVARLKRDHPDLARQVIDGQISPNKAAIQAGIRKPYIRVRADDERSVADALGKHYTPDDLLTIVVMLLDIIQERGAEDHDARPYAMPINPLDDDDYGNGLLAGLDEVIDRADDAADVIRVLRGGSLPAEDDLPDWHTEHLTRMAARAQEIAAGGAR